MICLGEEDSLYDTASFKIIHNQNYVHFVDPMVLLRFSGRFGKEFQQSAKELVANDYFSDQAFSAYLECCQMKPISISGTSLVDLLLICEEWDSPRLILKVEQLINTRVEPNEVIRLFIGLLKQQEIYNSARLEKIISTNLPRYIGANKFSLLDFDVIQRIISNCPMKISAPQIIKLCYEISAKYNIYSLDLIEVKTFDDMSLGEIKNVSSLFEKCPFPQLKGFLFAMSRLINQLVDPYEERDSFFNQLEMANTGGGDDAFDFFTTLNECNDIHRDGALSNSMEEYLRVAAQKGSTEAQYLYGKHLIEQFDEEKEDEAISYLIQSAAKNNSDAHIIMDKFFTLKKINISQHRFIFQVLALQSLLLSLNEENFTSSFLSLTQLYFGDDEKGVLLLTQIILKSVQIRQRSQHLYVRLIKELISRSNNYSLIKQFLFTFVIESLYTLKPMHQQFVYSQFLRMCYNEGVIIKEELLDPLASFLHSHVDKLTSCLILFYFFADIIHENYEDVFTYQKLKLFNYQEDYCNINILFRQFKDDFKALSTNNWAEFKKQRSKNFERDPLALAIMEDDLFTLRESIGDTSFDVNQMIDNYFVDITSEGTSQLSLIQYAATQGSESSFLYLLKRGANFYVREDSFTATCVACGQNRFIEGYISHIDQDLSEEMFRMSAKWNNMYLMILLMQNEININCADKTGSTALHFASRNANASIVQLLINTDGIEINVKDQNLVTPLHYAVFTSKEDIVSLLANSKGIELNGEDVNKSTPLHYAVWNNDSTMVKALLDIPGVNINARAKLDRTPLHEAAKCGFLNIVRILVSCKGIDINPVDKNKVSLILKEHHINWLKRKNKWMSFSFSRFNSV